LSRIQTPLKGMAGRKKKFLYMLCDGVAPEIACHELWPLTRDVPQQTAILMRDEKMKAAYAYLVEHRFSKEALLQKALALASDEKAKSSDKVLALKLASQLAGHITVVLGKPKSKEPGLSPKLMEIARKVENGHQKQAS
jgi:hypothetical protein